MKREKLSAQIVQSQSLRTLKRKFSKENLRSFLFSTSLILLSALFVSSCTNISSLSSRKPSSEVSLSSPSSGTGGSFQLTAVYASQQSPGTLYDMIGADSQFDTYCATGVGPCVCEFTYVSPGVGTITDQGSVVYQESNLLRCNNVVPSGVTSFDVKIVSTTAGYYSNTITTNLASGGFINTNYTDLSLETSYVQAQRFQCRKREFIKNPLSILMIDPIQSEDPKIIYPFNFYTTNVANSLWQMQQLSSQEWDCTLTPTQDRSLHWWANPYVFSASACTEPFCAGDGEWMYPNNDLVSGKVPVSNLSANGKRRASFSLAKQPYGVFQVAVKAAVGPNDYVSSKYDIIGYAARPIPAAGGVSTCPNITIPTNSQWVKLWNFRATDITPPKYVLGTTSMASSGIVCNTSLGVFPSCDTEDSPGSTNGFGRTLTQVTTTPGLANYPAPGDPGTYASGHPHPEVANSLASRVALLVSGNLNACYNIISMGGGKETWEPSTFGFSAAVTAQMVHDLPWEVNQQVVQSCQDAGQPVRVNSSASCNGGWYSLADAEPGDSTLTTATLTTSNYTDQIFVVTDPSVNDTNMRNQALSVSHYKPVTYRTSNDCNSASRAGCPTGKEIHWDINIKDVGAPTGPDQYPLCVLQFTD